MSENTIDGGLFFRRVLLVALVATLVVIVLLNLQSVVHYLLVVFAGVLLAVFLDGMATFLSQRTRLPRALALGLVVVVLFGLLAGSVWVAGPSVADQLAGLTERVPGAVNTVRAALEGTEWGRELLGKIPDFETLLSHWADVARFVQLALASTVSAIVDAIIILFIGIYLAATPNLYRNGVARLFPLRRRGRVHEVLESTGNALRWWLLGRFASMLVVGILTWLGLWLVGVPLAPTLALIAALLAFIPFMGPILGAIPACLVALVESPLKALWVIVVFAAVQLLETYLITPLIQQRAVRIAPALLISIQVLMALLFGGLGMLLATPIAVTAIVMIQMLYVQDSLGDRDLPVLGRREKPAA